jgi:hypothetical protein
MSVKFGLLPLEKNWTEGIWQHGAEEDTGI